MDNKEIIVGAIEKAGKALKSAEIAEATGIDKKEVDKTIKKMVAEGKINSPQRCFYAVIK